jgi:hypothetical protein
MENQPTIPFIFFKIGDNGVQIRFGCYNPNRFVVLNEVLQLKSLFE